MRLAGLSAAVILTLTACGSATVAAGAPTAAPKAPVTMPAATPSDIPPELARITDEDVQRAQALCARMQATLAPGSMPSAAGPDTAGHALRTRSATDPARAWLAAMPADQFVAMCGYLTISLPTGVPSALPSCPRGSGPVESSTFPKEFLVTEDGQYRPYKVPAPPFPLPTCVAVNR